MTYTKQAVAEMTSKNDRNKQNFKSKKDLKKNKKVVDKQTKM